MVSGGKFADPHLVQNTQDRDTAAIHLKLDELTRATSEAHNALLDVEELEDEKLDEFREKDQNLASPRAKT